MDKLINDNIVFPEFVLLYNDTNNTYIYYFRGLTEDNKCIYQDFNESNIPEHEKFINEDGSIIYKFIDNSIKSMHCKLISNFENIPNKDFFIKI